jgi:hypothetical protein
MIRTETRLLSEDEDWEIAESERVIDDEVVEEWYVLHYRLSENDVGENHEDTISVSFDEVKATGSLLELRRYNDKRATFAGVLNGKNEITSDSIMSDEIAEELKEIGPW